MQNCHASTDSLCFETIMVLRGDNLLNNELAWENSIKNYFRRYRDQAHTRH